MDSQKVAHLDIDSLAHPLAEGFDGFLKYVPDRSVKPGDLVIILAFGQCTPEEAAQCKPRVVVLGENNRIVKGPQGKD